jgi:hypothetical protein
VKIIINAEPDEMADVLVLVMKSRETFARHPERIGWGWAFSTKGGRSFFVRQIKGGLSASPTKPQPNRAP